MGDAVLCNCAGGPNGVAMQTVPAVQMAWLCKLCRRSKWRGYANCAGGPNGVAMQADLTREIDGETATLRIYFEIRGDEEQDDESIYDVKRVISVDRID